MGTTSQSVTSPGIIIELLNKKKDDYTDDDLSHMKKVISYVHRHSAQRPSVMSNTRVGTTLENWGHDPLIKLVGF